MEAHGAGRVRTRAPVPVVDPAALLEALPDLVVTIDARLRITYVNEAARRLGGWNPVDLVGRSAMDLVHPDDLVRAASAFGTVVGKDVGLPVEFRLAEAGGGYRWAEIVGRSRLEDAALGVLVMAIRDITDRRRLELAAGGSRQLETILRHAPTILALVGSDGALRGASEALTRQLGHDLDAVLGRPCAELVEPADHAALAAVLHVPIPARAELEVRLRHVDGSARPYRLAFTDLTEDPVVAGIVVAAHDVTELVRARLTLQRLAERDQLTGLLNRRALVERLEEASRGAAPVGLAFLDLDGFKPVNDELGHAAGDHVLRICAERLTAVAAAVGPAAVARVGGDEFAVLAIDQPTEALDTLPDAVRRALRRPMSAGGRRVEVTASVGLASAAPPFDPSEVLRAADQAMYVQKRRRRTHG